MSKLLSPERLAEIYGFREFDLMVLELRAHIAAQAEQVQKLEKELNQTESARLWALHLCEILGDQVSQLTAERDALERANETQRRTIEGFQEVEFSEVDAKRERDRLAERVKRLRERLEGLAAASEWIAPAEPRLRNWKDVATRHVAEAVMALAEDDAKANVPERHERSE